MRSGTIRAYSGFGKKRRLPPADARRKKMSEKSIRDRLVEHGQILFHAPKQPIAFTKETQADALLNDLTNHPHAFVLACVMDRQVKAERAWLIPYRISEKLGAFSMQVLCALSKEDVNHLMREPEPLHRFVDTMANHFYSAVQWISNNYAGDASRIWANKPSSAEVVYRFLEFKGVGPKIGSMAANILAREIKIPFSDYYSIDISADVHVRRVFHRLGLCPANITVQQVIYKARALYPDFPGMMDLPCWEIGRNWCKPRGPVCSACYMNDLCATSNDQRRLTPDITP
jgi:endonuclease III